MARDDWCIRATYYRIAGYPEPPSTTSFTLSSIFAEGNAIHDKWQGWLENDLYGMWRCHKCGLTHQGSHNDLEAGHQWGYCEVPLRDSTRIIQGRADGAIWPDTIIEFKSVGIGTLRRDAPRLMADHTHEVKGRKITDIDGLWKGLTRPLLPHIRQVNVYLHMASEMGLPFSQAAIVYEFKANQQAREFLVRPSPEIIGPLLTQAEKICYALRQQQPPACPFGGCAECGAWEDKVEHEDN